METLPLDLENIINDYKQQIEDISKHASKLKKCFNEMFKKYEWFEKNDNYNTTIFVENLKQKRCKEHRGEYYEDFDYVYSMFMFDDSLFRNSYFNHMFDNQDFDENDDGVIYYDFRYHLYSHNREYLYDLFKICYV